MAISLSEIQNLTYRKALDESRKALISVIRVIHNGKAVHEKFIGFSNTQKKNLGFNRDQIRQIEDGAPLEAMDHSLLCRIISATGDEIGIRAGHPLHSYIKQLKDLRNAYAHQVLRLTSFSNFSIKLNELKFICINILLELKQFCGATEIPTIDDNIAHLTAVFSAMDKPQKNLDALIGEETASDKRKLMDEVDAKMEEKLNKRDDILLRKMCEKMVCRDNLLLDKISEMMDQKNKDAPIYKGKPKGDLCYPNEKGRILFFNFIDFDDSLRNEYPEYNISKRDGAEEDSKTVEQTFMIHYEKYTVTIHENCTYNEMLEKCENLRRDSSLKDVDSLGIFIGSHGQSKTMFYTRDKIMDLDKIRRLFYEDEDGCLNLKGKFKYIFAHYCQGDGVEGALSDSDSDSIPSVLSLSDIEGGVKDEKNTVAPRNMKTVFSAFPGMAAHKRLGGGSYFYQHFCKVLKENAHLTFDEIVYKTNEGVEAELGHKNTFNVESSPCKQFYF